MPSFIVKRLAHSGERFTPRRRDAEIALFQDELDAAVFPAPLLVVIGGDRLLVAIADACQTRGRDALVGEISRHFVGATLRQRLIALLVADIVGVDANFHCSGQRWSNAASRSNA